MGLLNNLILVFAAISLTVWVLIRLLGIYGIIVPLLYMFFDVNWSFRVLWIVLTKAVFCRKANRDFVGLYETIFVVLPMDIDLNLHMNNARYLRECDFGRIDFWITSGMMSMMRKHNCGVTIAASSARYRKSLQLFQKVYLKTRVIAWDETAFYLEQNFHDEDGFLYAVVLTKNSVVQANKNERFISPAELVQSLAGWKMLSPTIPHDLQCWIQYNSASSAKIKNAL